MATPKPVTTGNTDITAEATWDQYVATPGAHALKFVSGRVRYTGTVWLVDASTQSLELVSDNVAFSTDHINITLSGFTRAPEVQVTPVKTASGVLIPAALATSADQVQIFWYDFAGVLQTSQGIMMDAYLRILGS